MPIQKELTIAIIQGDNDFHAQACGFLQRSGFRVWGAACAEDFYVGLLCNKADLVIADTALPGEGGLGLAQRLATRGIPSVLLAADADVDSRITGLQAGALQYFTKPVDLRELVAGICAILHLPRPVEISKAAPDRQEASSWQLNPAMHCLIAPNRGIVHLSYNELAFIECLLAANSKLVGKAQLLDAVGLGEDSFHRIESLLARLRRKTIQTTGMYLPVRSIYGKGFFFAQ